MLTAQELDERFDAGESIEDYLDHTKAHRPGLEMKRVNGEFPAWVVDALDREAARLGIARLSVLKTWTAEKAAAIQ
jgi:hypothetical protein